MACALKGKPPAYLRSLDGGATWEPCTSGDVRRSIGRDSYEPLENGATLTSPRGVMYRRGGKKKAAEGRGK